MATGDITGGKRPRIAANQRADTTETEALSTAARDLMAAMHRALLTTPRTTPGAPPTGLLVTGLSLTLNPTGASDGKVRLITELGVAVDADGRFIVKPAGVQVDVTIPVGQHQVYLYFTEAQADTATRRFLTVTPPYAEYAASTATTYSATYGVHVRAGATFVAEDTVNGVLTPLVAIGLVTNTAGACIVAGRVNNTTIATIPNGTDIVNRLSTVTAPTLPAASHASGTMRTLHDLLTATLYQLGRLAWLGSTALTPAAGNNFGAYNTPTQGVQKLRERMDAQRVHWQSPGAGVVVPGGTFSGGVSANRVVWTAGTNAVHWHTLHSEAGDQFVSILVAGNDVASVAPTFAVTIFRPQQLATSDHYPTASVTATRAGAAFGPFVYTLTIPGLGTPDLTDTLVQVKITSGAGSTEWTHIALVYNRSSNL